MTGADIGAGLRLCRLAGWNQLEADWRFFLNYPCAVAEVNGEVAGTVATLPYGWISMLLVDPAMRHRGIGSALLEEGMRLLDSVETIRLDATPAGQQLYAKFGFVVQHPILRLTCGARVGPCDTGVRAGTLADLPQIMDLDLQVFGPGRGALLSDFLTRAPQYALISDEGFCLGRPGYNADHIGPVVAKNPEAAQCLVEAAIVGSAGRPFLLDVPESEGVPSHWLRSFGCRPERPFVRMYRGLRPAASPLQFAIAGPEFG
jgi:predicted N-acetyltransferase YhbS